MRTNFLLAVLAICAVYTSISLFTGETSLSGVKGKKEQIEALQREFIYHSSINVDVRKGIARLDADTVDHDALEEVIKHVFGTGYAGEWIVPVGSSFSSER